MSLSAEQTDLLIKISNLTQIPEIQFNEFEMYRYLEKCGYIYLNPSFSDGYHPLIEVSITEFGKAYLSQHFEDQKSKAHRRKMDLIMLLLSTATLFVSVATLFVSIASLCLQLR